MATMMKFRCVAYSFEGVRTTRVIKAQSLDDAQRTLWEEGFRIVDMRQGAFRLPSIPSLFPSLFKVRRSEIILFTRQLGTFVKVGVPLLEALGVLHEQTGSREMRLALQDMMVELGKGRPLSAAMRQHPRIFDRLYVDMVRAAEVSGELDLVLSQISDYMTRDDNATRRIRAALIYPVIVVALAAAVITVLMIFVLPAFVHLFGEFNAELPLPTRILLAIGRFFDNYRLIIGFNFLVLVVAGTLFLRSKQGRKFWDGFVVKIPYLGRIIHFGIIERFLRTFATMTKAGIPVTQMFDTVIESTGNLVFEERLTTVQQQMIAGEGFAGPLRLTGLFPLLVIQMIRVGEETGTLDSNLDQAAEYYAQEIEFRTKTMIGFLEPGLIIFVGFVVAFVAISVISPMYGLVRAIH